MKMIKSFKLLALFLCLLAMNSFACESGKSDAFPALKAEDGFIVFNNEPLVDEGGQETEDVAIGVEFVPCVGNKKRIAGLPFLAATGTVKAAFFENSKTDGTPKLFIIHGVEIRSDTGVNYKGDYYSVHVFSRGAAGYVRDDRLSNYFGAGGDITSEPGGLVLVYNFPYKTADEISKKINSNAYKQWVDGNVVKLTMNKKTPIYSSANLSDITKMYLIKGDIVLQEAVEAGWIQIMFKTAKGKEIRGWVQCVDTSSC
ncbi:hypothetical protein [Pseudomonas mandelii]|uniref:hypothetical protein n=1 Tax=Pseudomonas mandelii TaxID=75612 RepID=UPI0020A031AF|nr:hypothetical protein [Pseudomonas mandelii]MCO8309940.1 hypothetical protein [Pseudomonas mandelii]